MMIQASSVLRFSVLLVFLLCFQDVAGQAKKIVLKVSLGDGPTGDFLGESDVYDMDAEGYTKQTSRNPIQGTNQAELFQKQRFSRGQDLMLRLPVPDGVYSVTLLMAEVYEPACAPGMRVFDISLGTPHSGLTQVEKEFDLFANAGCATAYGKRFDGVVSKDGIVVRLGHIKQHPTLAGYIVEGYPVPKGDGSEYKAIAQVPSAESGGMPGITDAGPGVIPGAVPAAVPGDSLGEGLGAAAGVAERSGENPSEPTMGLEPSTTSREDVAGAGDPTSAGGPEGSMVPGALPPQAPMAGESLIPGAARMMQAPSRRRLLHNGPTSRRRTSKKKNEIRGARLGSYGRLK